MITAQQMQNSLKELLVMTDYIVMRERHAMAMVNARAEAQESVVIVYSAR
jgi:hypothetical protein